MSDKTAFLSDERCFWHSGGNYAMVQPVGGLVQPLVSGGLPEAPETKRRLRNLIEVSGLAAHLDVTSAPQATRGMLERVHPASYLDRFKAMSDAGGGELGRSTPFGPGGYEIAALSVGLAAAAVEGVAAGRWRNAYALCRPPGHHCLPAFPNGFCLMNNLAVAVEHAIAMGLAGRVAIVDWDVHHGNGTEAIFLERGDVLSVSIHQDRCYPLDAGGAEVRGRGAGEGCNVNVPLPPGAGHGAYMEAMERIVLPALRRHSPDLVVVACGYDAACLDPLSRMMAHSDTFRQMTLALMDFSGGRLALAHEGGYSELVVPFCGHAVLEALSGGPVTIEDPLLDRMRAQQPDARMQAVHREIVSDLAAAFQL